LRLTKSWYVVGCARVFPLNRCIVEYGPNAVECLMTKGRKVKEI